MEGRLDASKGGQARQLRRNYQLPCKFTGRGRCTGGGVDTTLQRLTDLEGSVDALKSGNYWATPNTLKTIEAFTKTASWETVVNVSGKGKLWRILSNGYSDYNLERELRITVDGKSLIVHKDQSDDGNKTSCIGMFVTADGFVSGDRTTYVDFIDSTGSTFSTSNPRYFVGLSDFTNAKKILGMAIFREPLAFSKSMKIEQRITRVYTDSYFDGKQRVRVMYSLD